MKQLADAGIVPAHHAEVELLRCASRLRMEQQTTDQIRAVLRCDVDWNWLIRTSLDHGVTALMFHSLLRVGGDLLPEEIAAGANEFLRVQREKNRQRGEELLRILVALEKSGIPALPFKGPVLAQDVYEDIGLRSFEDLDFLVHQKDIPKCLDVLRDLHYEIEADYDIRPNLYYGHDLFLQTGFAAVEPHWRVVPSFVALRIDHTGIWRRARRAPLLDAEVSTFSAEDSLVFLCLHGSKHEWYKLQWISDVAETIRAYKHLNWSSVIENSRNQGCLRMVLLGSALARCQFGAEIPHNVELLIRGDPVLETLTSQVVEALHSDDCRPRGGPKLTRFNLRVREQLRDKAAFVAACIFLPRRLHFRLIPLPGPLPSLCAFPIKLLYDYCATPLWGLVKWFINGWNFSRCWIRYRLRGSRGRLPGLVDFVIENPFFNAAQIADELTALSQILNAQQPERALEIGTFRGGTLLLLCRLANPTATILSVDLPGGQFGGGYSGRRARLYGRFARRGQRLHLLQGDSHSSQVLDRVMAALGGQELDYLFLDGDHSYAGVRCDFEIYGRMVRKGGIIVFHDIVEGRPEGVGGVPRFWREIKSQYRHTEIIKDPQQGGCGIGVLYVD